MKIIEKLRNDVVKFQNERKFFHKKYQEECVCSKNLQKQITDVRNVCQKLRKEVDSLRQRLPLVQRESGKRKNRKRKAWCRLTCDRTKRQRILKYGDKVFSTLKNHVPHCRRAQLTLCLGLKHVKFCWKGKELQSESPAHTPLLNFHSKDDHLYASNPPENSIEDADFTDIDYSKIFDNDGNWQNLHKRGIIHVMDTYCISHEAYHELRNVGQDHFPPLHHIIREKCFMSEELTYIRHPTVSNYPWQKYWLLQYVFCFCLCVKLQWSVQRTVHSLFHFVCTYIV